MKSKELEKEIPDDVTDWRIEEYDGWEHIAEGRKWYGS
jgi:hypothetical protein